LWPELRHDQPMLTRLAGPLFVVTGALHFLIPDKFERLVPSYLPAHRTLVYASGVAEIAGGAGLMHPRSRRCAGWWLIATLVAVFPANVNMALHPEAFGARTPERKLGLLARLPLQLVFIAWVRAAAGDGRGNRAAHE
jgi:uncharacterized membrane protein